MKKFLFIIQFDSFSKTLIPSIERLLDKGYSCDVVLLKQKFYKKPWVSNDILLLFEDIKDRLGFFGSYKKTVLDGRTFVKRTSKLCFQSCFSVIFPKPA